jgi:hypothetical protein
MVENIEQVHLHMTCLNTFVVKDLTAEKLLASPITEEIIISSVAVGLPKTPAIVLLMDADLSNHQQFQQPLEPQGQNGKCHFRFQHRKGFYIFRLVQHRRGRQLQ